MFSQICGVYLTGFISTEVRYYYGLLSALQLLLSALCLIDTVGSRKVCDFIPNGNKTHTNETKNKLIICNVPNLCAVVCSRLNESDFVGIAPRIAILKAEVVPVIS